MENIQSYVPDVVMPRFFEKFIESEILKKGFSAEYAEKSKKILSQAATLLLYLTSAIFGTLAGGNIGTIPWTMKSMSLNFMQAMDYIWPMLLICSAISISAFIFACFLVNTKKPNNLDPVGA